MLEVLVLDFEGGDDPFLHFLEVLKFELEVLDFFFVLVDDGVGLLADLSLIFLLLVVQFVF